MKEHGTKHVTSAGKSVLDDLFDAEEAAELQMRAVLLRGLEGWLKQGRKTQKNAADILGIDQARVSDIKQGKISKFSLGMLVKLAARAGLQPRIELAA